MFKNYFLTAWRNLRKSRIYSAINILGLAIGMAACIIILLFVFYEKSFDKMHTKNIYRLDEVQKFEGMVEPQNVALSMFPMGPSLKKDFPEIKNFTRVNDWGEITATINDKKIVIPKALFADSTFFQIFDFPLSAGQRDKVLEKPNTAVLTEDMARTLFGKEDAIGKTISFYGDDTLLFQVTGLMPKVPANSHLKFDALFSFNTLPTARLMENWGGNWLITYLEIDKKASIASLEKKFPDFLRKYMPAERAKAYQLFLQPLAEVHANSTNITHDYLNEQKFDKRYTKIFFIIALIVLIIACINFVNLSTARSSGRAKEVGIRKSVGAFRSQLSIQFLGESILLCLVALVLAVLLVQLFLPYIRGLSDRDLHLNLFTNPLILPMLLSAALLVGILAGLYPAGYLSSFQPSRVLKGSIQTGGNKGRFRNLLVVGQFTGAIFLMIATVFAVRQLNFMRDKDPGFDREQVMLIPMNSKTLAKYDALKQEFLNNTVVTAVSGSQQRLGNNLHQTGVNFIGDGPRRNLTSSQVIVDPDYIDLYKIHLVAGKNFSKDANGKEFIVNEALAKELLKDNPKAPLNTLIGKRFWFGFGDTTSTIVGIAHDFNFNSLHHKIETLCIYNQKEWGFSEMSVRVDGKRAKEAIAHVQSVWHRLLPEYPLEYSFLDEHFTKMYKADMQVSKIVGILAALAIVISCLGLFGLASFSAEKRIKEIGIRKVLGASVQNVVGLLSKNFLKLVFIANLIAWPIAWFALDKWLSDFAYRINISWWVFIIAGLAALGIALFTVSFQAIRAAVSNPVKSLRSE